MALSAHADHPNIYTFSVGTKSVPTLRSYPSLQKDQDVNKLL